jgi:hypothetical protein
MFARDDRSVSPEDQFTPSRTRSREHSAADARAERVGCRLLPA